MQEHIDLAFLCILGCSLMFGILLPLPLSSSGLCKSARANMCGAEQNPFQACSLVVAILPSDTKSPLLLLGLTQFFSAATTVCAILMITLKIIHVTQKSPERRSYSRVIEILVQSAALESIVMTLNSMVEFTGCAFLESNSASNNLVIVFLELNAYLLAWRIALPVRILHVALV